MRCLVTGGAGFIGSHLVEALVDAGHEVEVLDDLSGGHLDNIATLIEKRKIIFHQGDILHQANIASCFEGIDWVFHLAGKADIVPSIESPELYYDANTTGTLNVLQCAKQAGVKRFIYAASSSCYGLAEQFPTPETAFIQPQYPYALTKYLGEQLVLHWGQVYQLPVVSLRLFNVYGPRVRTTGAYGAVFGVFLAQKAKGKPYTVVGDGSQTRDFTYVTDVARAFVMAAAGSQTQQVYNVGSGGHYSVNQLIEILEGERVSVPKRPAEPDCTFADIAKIQTELGWRAEVSFETGVRTMLAELPRWHAAPLWEPDTIAQATALWFEKLAS